MQINIKEVQFGTEQYKKLLELRYTILRRPLGLILSDKDTEYDDREYHIAAFQNIRPIGCVLLRPLNLCVIKLRQMAVSPEYLGQGLGSKLIKYAEEIANIRGFKTIEMNARRSAQIFYEKLGYIIDGEEFVEVTVPTIKMCKSIA